MIFNKISERSAYCETAQLFGLSSGNEKIQIGNLNTQTKSYIFRYVFTFFFVQGLIHICLIYWCHIVKILQFPTSKDNTKYNIYITYVYRNRKKYLGFEFIQKKSKLTPKVQV